MSALISAARDGAKEVWESGWIAVKDGILDKSRIFSEDGPGKVRYHREIFSKRELIDCMSPLELAMVRSEFDFLLGIQVMLIRELL